IRSVWPIAITTSRLTPLILPTRSSSLPLASGLITALSKSNSASAAMVTFSMTGLGAGGLRAGGLGAGFGGVAAGLGVGMGLGTRSGSHSAIAIAGDQ